MINSPSSFKQFGYAYRLTITQNDGDVLTISSLQFQPEPLHITFDTYQTIQQAFWYCDITIDNLNAPTEQAVLKQGQTVKLEAGYQSQPFGTIFEGTLFQPLWERIGGVDFRLTLRCIVGLIESSSNFVGLTIASGVSQRQIVSRMAAAARFPLNASNVDSLGTTEQSRASTYFGQPNDYFQNIADDTETNLWFSNMAVNIRELRASTSIPTIEYSPGTGLIGTPQQTQDGVVLTVNLDARLQLLGQIKLNVSTAIRQLPKSIPSYPTILDQNGLYIIGGIRHYGDSRSNTWCSDITGFTYAGSLLALQTQF